MRVPDVHKYVKKSLKLQKNLLGHSLPTNCQQQLSFYYEIKTCMTNILMTEALTEQLFNEHTSNISLRDTTSYTYEFNQVNKFYSSLSIE